MYKNILVPIALGHTSKTAAALDVAKTLLDEGGKVTALSVIEAVPSYIRSYLPEGQEEKSYRDVREALEKELAGTESVIPVVVTGHPGREILDYAQKHQVDCIVIASHRPGMQDYFLGSTAAWVVRHTPCAVHVVR